MKIAKTLPLLAFLFSFLAAEFPLETFAATSSIKSGNWSDKTVWSSNIVPENVDVIITENHEVIYDLSTAKDISSLDIKGTLRFKKSTPTAINLRGNVHVRKTGFLDMGTKESPISSTCKFTFILTKAQAAAYVGTGYQPTDIGLWNDGRWEVYGQYIKRVWTKIAKDVFAGDTKIDLVGEVFDWPIGAQVLITDTDTPSEPSKNEVNTIYCVGKSDVGGSHIMLDKPLETDHIGSGKLKGDVSILSRNIVISTIIEGDTSNYKDGSKRLFAHTQHGLGSTGSICYAQFYHMGHANSTGRYGVHYHECGEGSRGSRVEGVSIVESGHHGVVIHCSAGVRAIDNVVYDIVGIGFFSEAAFHERNAVCSPTDVSYIHNLAVWCYPIRGMVNFWRQSGYWPCVAKGDVHLGNCAVSCKGGREDLGAGFHFPEGSGFEISGIGFVFAGNEAHSNYGSGFFTWQNITKYQMDLVDNLAWKNSMHGFKLGAYSGEYYLHGCSAIQNPDIAVRDLVVDMFMQDCLIESSNIGVELGAYSVPQFPHKPHWNVSNEYRDCDIGFTHIHDACAAGDEKRPITGGPCGANYSYFLNNTFSKVQQRIDFGWHSNTNSFIRTGSEVLFRLDQVDTAKRTTLTNALIQPGFILDNDANALASALPDNDVLVTGLKNQNNKPYQFTFSKVIHLPPKIYLHANYDIATKKITLKADAYSNFPLTVHFFVDAKKIGEDNIHPYESSVDLSDHDGKFAYLRAVAYDGQESVPGYKQRSYGKVIEIDLQE